MDPALREIVRAARRDEVEAIIRLDGTGRVPADIRIVARFGDVATCRLARARIDEVWSEDAVISLKAPQAFGPDPWPDRHDRDAEVRRDEELAGPDGPSQALPARQRLDPIPAADPPTGRGVIVAAIDWGLDFAHANFRNADGSSRVLAFWDQGGSGDAPEPYGYGRVHERAAIDAALATAAPYAALGYHPATADRDGRGAHGTHVLDICTGNGRAPRSMAGVAPHAGILFVQPVMRGVTGRHTLGDSVTILEGVDWVRGWVARNAPDCSLVLNLSVGRHGGPHNGLTHVERAMDSFLREAPGRAVVQSCGNYYNTGTHAFRRLAEGREQSLRWIVKPGDVTPNELEVWYSAGDRLTVALDGPGGVSARVALGADAPLRAAGRPVGHLYHRATDPAAGDNHVNAFLDASAPAGTWRITLMPEEIRSGEVHLWVERDGGCPSCQSRFHPADAETSSTTNTICNGHLTLSIGAVDGLDGSARPAPFSSGGPTRDGRNKPDAAAPGMKILAAKSAPRDAAAPTDELVVHSGTSMAAPHVAGLVALMFEAAGRKLTIAETRAALLASCTRLDPPGAFRTGAGLVSARAAVEAARLAGRRKMPGESASPLPPAPTDTIDEWMTPGLLDFSTSDEAAPPPGVGELDGGRADVEPDDRDLADLRLTDLDTAELDTADLAATDFDPAGFDPAGPALLDPLLADRADAGPAGSPILLDEPADALTGHGPCDACDHDPTLRTSHAQPV